VSDARKVGVLVLAVLALTLSSCGGKNFSAKSMVGTWKHDRLVFMFDPDGSCQRFNLETVAFESGNYTVKGSELDIAFASGLGARYELHPMQSGDLQIIDIPTGNRFMLTRVPKPGSSPP
jgi:hypothetical protein